MAATLADARAALQRTFGYPAFRGMQPAAVESVLAGRDVLVLMPTGGGKSLCFQVPALVLPGLTLVVSPLISLMQDQVAALTRRGVAAAYINSALAPGEAAARLEAARAGRLRLLYVAPERFGAAAFRAALPGLRVSLLAIDEAHCIAEWGPSFRPAYLRLGEVRRALHAPCIALTASATPDVRDEIIARLELRRPRILAGGFDRPNLAWHVVGAPHDRAKDRLLVALLRSPAALEGSAIAYASTRRETDELADLLNRSGVPAAAYHAGISASERERLQDAFMGGGVRVVTATSAFGMGIDKPDVRLVVHHRMPASLESYYQEAGRAGRDGAAAACVLLASKGDRRVHDFLRGQTHPGRRVARRVLTTLERLADASGAVRVEPERLLAGVRGVAGEGQLESALRILEMEGRIEALRAGAVRTWRLVPGPISLRAERAAERRERHRLEAMEAYVWTGGCRRAFLLAYFGDGAPSGACPGCDRCTGAAGFILPGAGPPRDGALAAGGRVLERLRRAWAAV